MSPDPYSGSYDTSNPQSFNRYSYALNNPAALTDPEGLDGENPISIGGAVGVCTGAVISGGANGIADIGCGLSLFTDIVGLFGGPSFHGTLSPRPSTGNPNWDGNFGESLGIPTSIPPGNFGLGMALGLPSQGCEFGACGGGGFEFGPDDPDAIGDVMNLSVGADAALAGIVAVGKSGGCALAGFGKGLLSFFGLPSGYQAGPPSPSSGVRAARGAYNVGAPELIYTLSKLGPIGRAAGDLIPGTGEILILGQGGLAVYDGGKVLKDCASKTE
jgi:hypothetical protein